MFRDLKEYQDITKIYQDSVHISEEERIITLIIREENFTQEELGHTLIQIIIGLVQILHQKD